MEKKNTTTKNRVKKIVVIGPECTGKSSLSKMLAEHYNTVWVPEYAREYIDNLDRSYVEQDLVQIAKGQLDLEEQKTPNANHLLICDTNLIVIKIWSEHKYGHCSQFILDEINSRTYDLYLLTYIDIPWEDDPQRENPKLRKFFYNRFKTELQKLKANFVEISGNLSRRKETAVKAIDQL